MGLDTKRAPTEAPNPSPEQLAETAQNPAEASAGPAPPRPGVILVFSAGRPACRVIPSVRGLVEIGRDARALQPLQDPSLSRSHARVVFDGAGFWVTDLESRNGTSLNGKPVTGDARATAPAILRTGATLFLLSADTRGRDAVKELEGVVMGSALEATWSAIARAAQLGKTLHLRGESGSGKDIAARAFHASGPSSRGPFVPVNCAAIPAALAERLLFGARRGAFSGATADADGYVQAAHGGTLFLDEVAELDPSVQAKLLRTIESREVLPLGAVAPDSVDFRLCTASHKDLRAEVAAGRLRQDFYFRIARPDVTIPPLRDRPEEMPTIIAREISASAPALLPDASLVETCLLRPWPGNVRELVAEIRAAAQLAIAEGCGEVKARHLAAHAGQAFELDPSSSREHASQALRRAPLASSPGEVSGEAPGRASGGQLSAPDRAALEALMHKHRGVIKEVAEELGCSRRQVGRWLADYGLDRSVFRASGLPSAKRT
jgi:DNA-binding NtrC family response regulator